jgi:hypothetical protein
MGLKPKEYLAEIDQARPAIDKFKRGKTDLRYPLKRSRGFSYLVTSTSPTHIVNKGNQEINGVREEGGELDYSR